MLADSSSASERQALLARPVAQKSLVRSCVERCLFCLSDGQLMMMLAGLFLLRLAATGEMQAWLKILVLMFKADVIYTGLLVTCIVCMGIVVGNIKLNHLGDLICSVSWLFLMLTITWYAMLKISEFHQLETQCWLPKHCQRLAKNPERPNLEGLANVSLSWAWLPMGLFQGLLGTLWRPAWFFLYVVPLAAVGQGSLATIPWWQWREVIIGSVFWPLAIMVTILAAAIEEDRRRVALLSAIFTLLLTAVPFYMTSDPAMAFWAFLFAPWSKICKWSVSSGSKELQMPAEEWGALIVMIWWIVRVLYVVASMRLEEFNARQRVEEGLRYAIEHPFRADLEQGFAMHAVPETSEPSTSCAQRGPGEEPPCEAAVVVRTLTDKRQQLIEAVRESSSVIPRRLLLRVRRSNILEDTWRAMIDKPVLELLAPSMIVTYSDEMGSDAGGLTRDWFHAVASTLVQGVDDANGSSLFATAPDGTLIPRPVRPDEDQEKFRHLLAAGRFLALAVYREQPLPMDFGLISCKHILGVPVGMDDVRQLDPEFYRGRVEAVLREEGLATLNEALDEPLTFMSAASAVHPDPEPLKEGGALIEVTNENKAEYVQLLCEAYLCSGIRREIQSLLQGFYALLPFIALRQCKLAPRELSVLISGVATLDPEEWQQNSYCEDTQIHNWFWEVTRAMNIEQRCMLLHFTTGSSRLPPGGFANLKPIFTVTVSPGQGDRLPVAHTCVNQLVLQEYETKEILEEKLLCAISTDSFELV